MLFANLDDAAHDKLDADLHAVMRLASSRPPLDCDAVLELAQYIIHGMKGKLLRNDWEVTWERCGYLCTSNFMTKRRGPVVTDPERPPPEAGIQERILRLEDTNKIIVEVSFTPLRTGLPPIRSWRRSFPTTVLANEFARSLHPNPRQLGSNKWLGVKLIVEHTWKTGFAIWNGTTTWEEDVIMRLEPEAG